MQRSHFLIVGIILAALFLFWLFPVLYSPQTWEQKTAFWLASFPLFLTIVGLVVFWQAVIRSRLKNFNAERPSISLTENNFAAETINSLVKQLETDRRQQRQRAETAEEFNQRVVAGLPSGLIVFDSQKRVLLANKAASQIFATNDKSPNNLTAQTVFQNIPKLATMVEKTIKNGEIFRRETLNMHSFDGRRRVIGASLTSLSDANNPNLCSALCLMTDITEVTELREQFALRQNLASLGEMAAGLTHEFKNSLATIQTLAQFLLNANADEKQACAAQSILVEINSLSQIVTSFLDFARPQKLNSQNFSLGELIAECLDELESSFQQTAVSVKMDGTFPLINGDTLLLKRVFLNLLRNAFEACADGVHEPLVLINSQKIVESNGKETLEIKIEDSGRGIRQQDLDFVFVPFFTTKTQGHGIGLALSHRIVTEHGGTLAAANSQAGGAVFTCRLPLK